jgi:hypothetical protein
MVLLVEEWYGQRKWLRLAPFVGISLSFGGQALLANRGRGESSYTLKFTMAALADCVRFYGRHSWGLPWLAAGGWAWLRAPERRWIAGGIFSASVLLGPLLFLPGRLFAVYLYAPLMFGAIAVGVLLNRCSAPVLALLAIGYGGVGLRELRAFRRTELTQAQATREFVESACQALKRSPGLKSAWHEGAPAGLQIWGVEAALRLCSGNLQLQLRPWELKSLERGDLVIRWTKMPGKAGFVEVAPFGGDLAGDWYAWDGSFRWMGERASMKVKAQRGDRHLVLDLASTQVDEIEVRLDGVRLEGSRRASRGEQRLTFELPPMVEGERVVEIVAHSPRRVDGDPRELGVAVRLIQVTP